MYDKELADDDVDELEDQEDGSQMHALLPAHVINPAKARFLTNLKQISIRNLRGRHSPKAGRDMGQKLTHLSIKIKILLLLKG